jgi:L-ascorbate metabolism protein UlaG (beta-lactamase superfamily)
MTTRFTYYGISFFQIEAQGRTILVDPCIRHNSTCPIKVEDITRADMILVTHGAPDHMGDAVEVAQRTGAILISGPAVRVHAVSYGIPESKTRAVLWGDWLEELKVGIQTVECRHISFFRSKDGFLSDIPLSFVISPEAGVRVYNVGDSALFSDMKLIGELYRPNVALVPIGGNPGLTGGYTHLAPREASLCVQWVRPRVVIPTHFDPATADGSQFASRVHDLSPDVDVKIMQPGDVWEFRGE